MSKKLFCILCLGMHWVLFFSTCEEKKKPLPIEQTTEKKIIKHAKNFTINKNVDFTVIEVSSAWPGAENTFRYALIPSTKQSLVALPNEHYDAIITTPVKKIIVTSTTHIPALDTLGVVNTLVGFPNTDLVSSPKTRERIQMGKIMELGNNETLNTEVVLDLQPDVVIGFGINDENNAYKTLNRSSIPVVYNGEWTEQTPLGKAEWIKFFAVFYEKEALADSIFSGIEKSYNDAKVLAKKVAHSPTVLTGGLYKDVWHVAGGKSWMAQFLKDANTNYLWQDNQDTGGIPLSLESVLEKARQANFWLNPSLLSTYAEMEAANAHYKQFDAFTNRKVFSNAVKKGPTGGLLYYELAPQRPDLVLKDLVAIFHPELLPEYDPYFFKPLQH